MKIRSPLNALAELFYPSICNGCNNSPIDHNEMLCMRCMTDLPYTAFETIQNNPIEKLFWGRMETNFALSIFYFEKQNIIQRIIHEIKYCNGKKLGVFMGKLMGIKLISVDAFADIDFMIPMPLHPKKEKKRGYNQATLLCKGISEICNVNYLENAILRQKNTQTQTRKSRLERWENVEEVFTVPNPMIIQHKKILIIDDVITTGASTEACGQTLLNHGAKSISVCGLAHAVL